MLADDYGDSASSFSAISERPLSHGVKITATLPPTALLLLLLLMPLLLMMEKIALLMHFLSLAKKKPRRNSRRRLNSNSLSAEERERREIAFPPRAPFRFCLQYLMSDSAAAAAVADWQPAAVANCLFQRRGLEGGHRRRTRRHAAREINFNTRNGCPPG